MKIIIFGATGKTGRKLLEQALEQGHFVTAFARNPAKLDVKNENLQIVQGDVMNLAAVEQAVQVQEAVMSAIGAPDKSREPVRSEGTQNIIRAMEEANVRRFISISTIGVGDSRETLPFLYKYILVPLFLRHAFADHEIQENYIKQSQLDWTIIRPAALTDDNRTGAYRHGFPVTEKNLKLKISRADVADFMLKQLTDKTYFHKTPGVSY